MSLPLRKYLALSVGLLSLHTPMSQAETLAEIYSLALESDHQLKADTAAYLAGKEALAQGRAGLLPQINAEGSYSESDEDSDSVRSFVFEGEVRSSATQGESDSETTSYSVSLTQPLFNMAAWFGYQQGKNLSNQAEAQFSADQQSLIIRVADAYFNVLRAIDNLETSIAEEKALSHQLEQTKQRFEVGLTAITDVHEAQAAYDSATATTLQARGNMGIAYEALEVLTGQPHSEVAPLKERFPVVSPEPAARHEWVAFALNNNYALKAAKFSAEAARQNAKVRASGHLPTLTGSLSYRDSDSDGTDTQDLDFISDSEATTVALSLQVPIYSGGRTSSQRRQAHQQFMQSQELYNKAQRDTIQNARSLHLTVTTDVAQVKARKQAITSNKSALEATQAGYEVGTRNLVDVLVAQRNLYQAQRNFDNARYDYVINMLRLKEVAGNLTPEDIQQMNQWLDSQQQVNRADYEK